MRWGEGGSANSPALPFPFPLTGLDWTGRGALWSLEAHSRYRGEHPLSVFASRFSLVVGRLFFLVVASKWLVVHGQRSAEAHGFFILHPPLPASPPSTTHLTRLSPLLPPLPGSSATPLPPQVTLKEAPPQSPPVPPSTPPAPPRPLPGTANILRPAFGLHYITQPAAPPGVALHHTPFCASDLFRPRPSPSSSKAGLHLRRLLCSRMPFDW